MDAEGAEGRRGEERCGRANDTDVSATRFRSR